jgi:hypothetical protein
MNDQKSSSTIRRSRVFVSGTLLLVAAFVLAAIGQLYAHGHALSIAGYLGFNYGGAVKEHPTGEKPESKLWWHDGFWWGSLFSPEDNHYRIFRYDTTSHNWVKTDTPIDWRLESRADALWDPAANKLYIVSHIKVENPSQVNSPENWAWLFRYSYDAGTKTYHLDSGFPVQSVNRDRTETVVIDKDSSGRLWVTYVSRPQGSDQYHVYVNYSLDDGLNWAEPLVLPFAEATVDVDDISSLIAFSDNGGPKIGVMWSNQRPEHNDFYFAAHPDHMAPAEGWSLEKINFPYPANDHVNLARTASGQVLAAVKSIEPDDPEQIGLRAQVIVTDPLIVVVARDLNGSYSFHTVSFVDDRDTRPIIVVNEQMNQAHVFATSKVGGGTVCRWTAFVASPLANMTFPTGNCPPSPQAGGAVIVLGDDTYTRINNATSTKQRVSSQTDLLILAADETARVYVHNYLTQVPPIDGPYKLYMPLIARQ